LLSPSLYNFRLIPPSLVIALLGPRVAPTVMVAHLGTSAADLWLVALVGFVVRDLLAVVALLGAVTSFKHFRGARLSSSHEEPFLDESPGF
jgi:hypothetical protein